MMRLKVRLNSMTTTQILIKINEGIIKLERYMNYAPFYKLDQFNQFMFTNEYYYTKGKIDMLDSLWSELKHDKVESEIFYTMIKKLEKANKYRWEGEENEI